ncbi:hypothetical protein Dimus_001707 [Dionaea muscipula]
MMVSLMISNANPSVYTFSSTRWKPPRPSFYMLGGPGISLRPQGPKSWNFPNETGKPLVPNAHYNDSVFRAPKKGCWKERKGKGKGKERGDGEGGGWGQAGRKQMLLLCGFGYWMQGFRCFPWLALNFHMAHNLNFEPSTLQLVQNSGNLPMVAKPFYGILSDALYIGGAHRVPYIFLGVVLQVLSWGPMATIPFVGDTLPTLVPIVLLSNLGAAITEVAQDALVAEYGQKLRMVGLQSYTFMAIAVAGILGNSLGGMMLTRTHPRTIFFIYTGLLLAQLIMSLGTREDSLGLLRNLEHDIGEKSVLNSIRTQCSDLVAALNHKDVLRPLVWVVASISVVPILSGSIFCYQTQFLDLDPTIIGLSRVASQIVLLSLTILYNQIWKSMPMRKLIGTTQLVYAATLILDLILVKQVNKKMGITNEVFSLCFSGVAETVATFKTVPFFVLIASLCPPGSEASLTSFLASALCVSSIVGGFLGIGLASVLGVTSGNYSCLHLGILIQFVAALVPLIWIHYLPDSGPEVERDRKMGMSKKCRRNRRVGRVVLNSIFSYRRERESKS